MPSPSEPSPRWRRRNRGISDLVNQCGPIQPLALSQANQVLVVIFLFSSLTPRDSVVVSEFSEAVSEAVVPFDCGDL